MQIKMKLIATTALFAGMGFVVAAPLFLTSCSNSGLNIIDFDKYDGNDIQGIKTYMFYGSHGSENEFYNKSSTDIKTMLGIENSIPNNPLPEIVNGNQFSRLISGVQFKEMSLSSILSPKSLSYSDVNSSAVDNQDVECYATIMDTDVLGQTQTTIQLIVTLKEGGEATWSNGSKSPVVFMIAKSLDSFPI